MKRKRQTVTVALLDCLGWSDMRIRKRFQNDTEKRGGMGLRK
jgi:hypothetical protein